MDIIEDISQTNIDALPFDEWAEMACLDFDGDVVITDPCYLLHGIDRDKYRHWWDFSNKIILEGGLENSTYYGDWGCTVYKKDNCDIGELGKTKPEPIGHFCADAGMVCVVHLRDVLKHNPNFKVEPDDRCTALIRGFKGCISFYCKKTKAVFGIMEKYADVELRILGKGEKDGKPFYFETAQTSL